MTGRGTVDISPPVHREMKDKLDRSVFHKTVEVLAVKVPPSKAGVVLKAEAMRGCVHLRSRLSSNLIISQDYH